jgi:pimeloyl-ACP methyl ester carboxylesterase
MATIAKMPYLERPGARLYYETHGFKPGPGVAAIVFAHGAGGNHLSWWQQVPHVRDRYAVLVYDHRRWGLSSEEPGGPGGAAFAEDLAALMDHVSFERASIVAQSMGGWTSLRFALGNPDRVERLMLCDTHGGLTSPEVDGWAKASAENAAQLPAGIHPAIGERIYREQPAMAFLYEEIDALNSVTRPEIFAAIQAAGTVAPEEAASLRMPATFLIGEEDIVIPPPFLEAAAALIPHAQIERIPRASHSVYFERPDEFNAALDRFLAS